MLINRFNGKIDLNKLIEYLIFGIFLTSSFDIFLSVNIGGFTFRISQLLCIALFVLVFGNCIKNKKIKLPLGSKQLISWVLIVLLFTFNTVYPPINIGYHMWLIFNVLIIVCFVQIINKENYHKYLRLYVLSFFIMAIIGILQAGLSVIGVKGLHVAQWWIRDVLPRINGFSYEPSYYATYMLIGWSMCRILLKNKELCKKLRLNMLMITIFITVSIILSSSRMGIALMIAMEFILFFWNFYNYTKQKNYKYKRETIIQTVLFIISILIVVMIISSKDLTFLLQGTGLNGTSNHSVSYREKSQENVMEVFKQSPIFGKGLGGIYAEIAAKQGYDPAVVNSQDVATGNNVFIEVLAASGIIGFSVFIAYLLKIIMKPLKLAKKINKNTYYIMISLIIALIMELTILNFNQNILRIYLWIHIAMVSSYYNIFVGEKKK